jgi:hypothetical protein
VDLHGLLLACPELENLSLNSVFDICSSEARVPLELTSSSLKSFTWQNWTGNWTGPKLVAEKLESFHLKDNENPSHLHVVTKGNLQEVRIKNSLGTGLKIEGDFHLLHVLDFHSPGLTPVTGLVSWYPFKKLPTWGSCVFGLSKATIRTWKELLSFSLA